MRRLRILLGISVAAAAVGGILYLTRPSAYEWYTSEPLDKKGTRVEFLVPRGWHQTAIALGYAIEFTPPERPGWWPGWLRRMIPEPEPFILVLHWSDGPTDIGDYKKSLNRDDNPYRIIGVGDRSIITFIHHFDRMQADFRPGPVNQEILNSIRPIMRNPQRTLGHRNAMLGHIHSECDASLNLCDRFFDEFE